MRSLRFHDAAFETSSAAKNEKFCNFAQPRSAFPIRCEFGDSFRRQIIGNLHASVLTQKRPDKSLSAARYLSRGFSERRGRLFDVQNVVRDLKRPANGLAKMS